jgi:hypothetical protein
VKRPKKKTDPRNVCVVDRLRARKMEEQGLLDLSYRCVSRLHQHLRSAEAKRRVKAGELEWVGLHRKVTTYPEEKVWAKTPSEDVTTMQLLPKHQVLARRRRH